MDEIRTSEGGKRETEPLRKVINERDGLAVLHLHERLYPGGADLY